MELYGYQRAKEELNKFVKEKLPMFKLKINQTTNMLDIYLIDIEATKKYKYDIFSVSFSLGYFPLCCGYGIWGGLSIENKYKDKKIATLVFELLEILMRNVKISACVCTIIDPKDWDSYQRMAHLLEKFGWKPIDNIVNCNTRNKVLIYKKDIIPAVYIENEPDEDDDDF